MDMFPTSTTTLHFQVDMVPPEARSASAEMFEDKAYKKGLSVHAILVKMCLEDDLFMCNHLTNMYAKCNNFESAHRIFDGMHERNPSWSALIVGYDQAGKHTMVMDLFA